MPDFYPEGNTVLAKDGELRTLHKIADCICNAGGGIGGSVRHGEGIPVGVNPGTTTSQYTDDLTGLQYTYIGGNWI